MGSWADYLRRERSRLIEDTEFLRSGKVRITRTEAGQVTDLTPGAIEANLRNVAEIQDLLMSAGEAVE